jgi:hypothetical protein
LKFPSFDSYFLCLIKESKQRKSSQKKPASRTGGRFPVFWLATAPRKPILFFMGKCHTAK